MAGLTPTEVRDAIELVRRIHGDGITIVVVEHIMEVITSLTRRVVVFHQGREIARGTPREVTSNPKVIEVYLGRRHVKHAGGDNARHDDRAAAQDRASGSALRRSRSAWPTMSLGCPKEPPVVALLGSNGAGKTTTLNAIAGIARVSAQER